MNKKILISLMAIVIVAGAAVWGTTAYFSDTETSTGNTFTAGAIDLKIDHTRQVYNNLDCQMCNVLIQSDTSNEVVSGLGNDPGVSLPRPAEVVTPTWITDQYWVDPLGTADWIWATTVVTDYDWQNTVTYVFEKKFQWHGPADGASLSFGMAADNQYRVTLNGEEIAKNTNESNSNSIFNVPEGVITANLITNGENVLRFEVTNLAQPQYDADHNPGGLMYRMVINGDCKSDWFQQHCNLWQSKDLGTGDIFYNFDDIKPGDSGLNVISLNVTSNDAYACLLPKITSSTDEDINEPEQELDTNPDKGELEDQTYFFAWLDLNGDGVYEPGDGETGEPALTDEGPVLASTFLTTPLDIFTPDTDSILPTGETQYLGIAWCAGTMTVSPTGVFGCDGNGMNNAAQTDILMTDLSFYVEQVRNNELFVCPTPSNNPITGGEDQP